jgi:PAS domain S-box-containing protein
MHKVSSGKAILKLNNELEHLKGGLNAIRMINRLIYNEKNVDRLLQQACEIIVKTMGYHCAFIVLLDNMEHTETVYHSCFKGKFGPMEELLQSGRLAECFKPAMGQDFPWIAEEPSIQCPGCLLTESYEDLAGMVMRLAHMGTIYGVLAISMPRHFLNVPDEQELFSDICNDLAFALYSLDSASRLETLTKRYSLSVETSSNAMLTIDLNGTITQFNPASEKMSGCSVEEVLGTSVSRFCPPELLGEQKEKIRQVIEKGTITYVTERMSKDGNRFPAEVTLDAIRDKRGRYQGVNAILADISERRSFEQQLIASEEKYRALYDNAPLSYQSLDEHGRLLDVNPTWLKTLGYEREEVVGKSYADFLHQDSIPHFEKKFPELKRRGFVSDVQSRLRHKHGHHIHVSCEGRAGYRPDGTFRQAYCVFKDITEQKKAEEKLRESEGFLRSILETMADGFWVADMQGRILEVNEAYERMSGYSSEELAGLRIEELDALETREMVLSRIEGIRKKGSVRFETSHRSRDGGIYPVEVAATFVENTGGRLVCFIQDLTKRKQEEERIALMSQMLDAAPVIINIIDEFGRIRYANRASVHQYGYDTAEEMAGLTVQELDVPEHGSLIETRMAKVMAKGEVRFEVQHRRRGGSVFPLEVMAKRIAWEGRNAVLSIAVDVSERKKADEALMHSYDLMQYVIEHTNSMVAVHDRDLRYVYVSQRYVDEFRIKEPNIVGKHHYEIFPNLPHRLRDVHQRVLAGEVLGAERDPYHHEDGTIDWMNWQCRPWYAGDGSVAGIVVYIQNMTEWVQADEALRRSEEFQRAIISASPLGIITLDLEGQVLSWNKAAERMYGWSCEEVKGKLQPNVPEDQLEISRARRAKVIRGESFNQYEVTRIRKDGSSIEVSISTVPIYDKDGHISAILGVHMDITERRKAEEARRLSEYRYRAIFEQASDGIIVHDLAGNLVDFNDVAAFQSGWTREELIGKTVFDFLVDKDRNEILELWDRLPMHEPVMIEKMHRKKDGTSLPAEVKIEKVLFDDQKMIVALVRDLTERKEHEKQQERVNAQLAQAQKMEAVGRLAGGVAHDFNNMLSVINGYAEMLLNRYAEDGPHRKMIQGIHTAGTKSAELVRQLLAFARKQSVAPQVLNLNDSVNGLLPMLRRLVGENITLLWKPSFYHLKIKIDPTQMHQLLTNLIINSRDAIEDVGTITIKTDSINLNHQLKLQHFECPPGKYVYLEVSDTGVGMDEHTLMNAFEPFFTTKPEGKGTGLGLSTVFGIINQNGGCIDVKSQPGIGTSFNIYFPQQEHTLENTVKVEDNPKILAGTETILLVEDKPEALKLFKNMLESLGYHVLCTETPEDALQIARDYHGTIDLLLTDVIMPEMNGMTLRNNVAKIRHNIRTIFMSGYSANIVDRNSLGADIHFLEKPFTLKSLSIVLRKVIEKGFANRQ